MSVLNYLDDILFIIGIGCLTRAAFLLHDAAGWAMLGIGCIAYAVFIAKGGASSADVRGAKGGGSG